MAKNSLVFSDCYKNERERERGVLAMQLHGTFDRRF
jgi:hypothetical protein